MLYVVTLMNIPGWHSIHPEEIIGMNTKPIIGIFSTESKAFEVATNHNIKTFGLEKIFSIENDNIKIIYKNVLKYINDDEKSQKYIIYLLYD